ncbi:MAG: hypothetical protein Fur005_30660 [Roseiflexaceae bacterium]
MAQITEAHLGEPGTLLDALELPQQVTGSKGGAALTAEDEPVSAIIPVWVAPPRFKGALLLLTALMLA